MSVKSNTVPVVMKCTTYMKADIPLEESEKPTDVLKYLNEEFNKIQVHDAEDYNPYENVGYEWEEVGGFWEFELCPDNGRLFCWFVSFLSIVKHDYTPEMGSILVYMNFDEISDSDRLNELTRAVYKSQGYTDKHTVTIIDFKRMNRMDKFSPSVDDDVKSNLVSVQFGKK